MEQNKIETIIKHLPDEPNNVYSHMINTEAYIEARTKQMELNKQLVSIRAEKEVTEQEILLTNKIKEIERSRNYLINLINRERAILTKLEECSFVIDLFETKIKNDTIQCREVLTNNSNHWSRIK